MIHKIKYLYPESALITPNVKRLARRALWQLEVRIESEIVAKRSQKPVELFPFMLCELFTLLSAKFLFDFLVKTINFSKDEVLLLIDLPLLFLFVEFLIH